MTSVRRRLTITGTVQGVGFRPFIWRLARRHGLDGWVANGPGGVTVDLQGAAAAIDALLDHVRHEVRIGRPMALRQATAEQRGP